MTAIRSIGSEHAFVLPRPSNLAMTEPMQTGASDLPPKREATPPFEALRAFDAIARLGGIRKAADWLDRDHAVISRHLRALEKWCGQKLVERTPVGVVLTKAGKSYHASIARALDQISHATLDLVSEGQHKKLVVWSSPGFALHWLTAHLRDFERNLPGVDIEVRPSEVDPDFAGHQADLQIRFVADYQDEIPKDPALRHEEMVEARIIAVAAPSYFEKHPEVSRPEELLSHELLHETGFENWIEWLKSYEVDVGGHVRGPRLWQGHLTMNAARHGNGIALSNSIVAHHDLSSGALCEIGAGNDAFPARTGHYLLVARKDRWNDGLLNRFRGWLQRRLNSEFS